MERGSIGRWLLIAASVFFFLTVLPKFFGGGSKEFQPLKPETPRLPNGEQRPAEKLCDIWGPEFRAQLTTRGASLKHFQLTSAKYKRNSGPIDLATTPEHELRQQLRLSFRSDASAPASNWNVELDSMDWELLPPDGKACHFTYRDAQVELHKWVRVTPRPYELEVEASIKNLASEVRSHTVSAYTETWRREEEVRGGTFRVSPLVTHVECVLSDGKATRALTTDFEPGDFKDSARFPHTNLNPGEWYEVKGRPEFAAVSNAYFSQALVHVAAPNEPTCQLQIEQRWDHQRYPSLEKDPNGGAMYRGRLAYPLQELQPGASAQYSLLSYIGPKERKVLGEAGGGRHQLLELIDLGFFSAIAKVLVAFLLKVHSIIPNWGIAIIILTFTARTLLFPLSLPSIRSMIKMREMKPEVDALNERFKDDPQARGLAQMELWRKHQVNPLKGCLPQLASMPVWFALYTTLQTAVELYNTSFLWFPDLSSADPLYILPFVIGGTSFIQQRLMPLQGDPAQQKMMLYFMPAMFTVFMLFLPAGLGVYMFTNGVLGILQQQLVERHVTRSLKPSSRSGIQVQVVRDAKGQSQKPSSASTKPAK